LHSLVRPQITLEAFSMMGEALCDAINITAEKSVNDFIRGSAYDHLRWTRPLEPRHHVLGEELQGSERFTLLDAAEVNLHRRLMLSDEITIKLDLLDHFIWCSH
jgi:hypothetical protein